MRALSFENITNGIWKASVGKEYPTLLGLANVKPKERRAPEREFPFFLQGISAKKVLDKHVIAIPFSAEEHLYGLGLSFQSLCKNFTVVPLRVDHYGGKDNGRTHVPTPFYVSDRGYGILIDTTSHPTFYMGGTIRRDAKNPPPEKDRATDADWSAITPSEFVEVSFDGPGADVYVIAGEGLRDVVARFHLLCGGGCMVPKWGLGFWERLHIRSEEKDVYQTLAAYREHDMLPDVLGLEPGWQSRSYPCSFDVSRGKYPDFEKMTRDLLAEGIRLNLWENLYVSRESSLYDRMLPLAGSHMVWNGIVPDLTMEEAKQVWSDHHRALLDAGVSGFKIDECDGYDKYLWPDHAEFPSGHSAVTLRQSYGLLAQKTVYDTFRRAGKRTYGLVRASNAGATSYPFCVYNDCYTFRDFLGGICSSAFCGALWVPEVRDAKSPEEWVRRFQLCVLSPMMMLNSWSTGAKPWKFPEVEDVIRDLIVLRKRLLPYLYTAFYTYHTEGIPPFRPICMDFGTISVREAGDGALDDTANPYQHKALSEVTDQFMVGDCMMVAPLLPEHDERDVVLPADCGWYDFFTGAYIGRGDIKRFRRSLDQMIVLVREGGMVPMIDRADLKRETNARVTVKCFGERGQSTLYDDDGISFDFEDGVYRLTRLFFERRDGKVSGQARITHDGYCSPYEISFE